MKKVLIVFLTIIAIVLAAAFIIPLVFKDEIKTKIDQTLSESVNADVVWDDEDFSISLFSNFPNATAALTNFGIINKAPFEGQVLFAVEKFEVEVDLFSLFGDQIRIKGIEMNRPEIFIKVLPDGTANYDIAVADEAPPATAATDTAAAEYNIGIDHWEITNGNLTYEDQSLPFTLKLQNLEHSGSGDFTQDVFDLVTETSADSVQLIYDDVKYLSDKHIAIDAVFAISDNYSKFTFKENNVTINDFNLNFDGVFDLLENGDVNMDIRYGTRENSFKSLLSLVPGVYTEDFDAIETDGTLAFQGAIKGKLDSLSLPAFNLALQVDNAMFKYPDLPTAVKNIDIDLLVNNTDGNIDNTRVELKDLHMEFGENPLDAKILIKNLYNYEMKAEAKGSLNLEQLSSIFPMEGLTLKGKLNIDLEAAGVYDSVKQVMPVMNAVVQMENGYVKSAEFPAALENVSFDARINDPSGRMADFKAVVDNFNMLMDGEPFVASLVLKNLNDYNWDLSAKGSIDLNKISQIFSLEGMTLAGKVKANVKTRGKMSDLEAERYANLPTSGTVTVENFEYTDKELPYKVTISTAKASFDPRQMTLSKYEGTVGRSQMSMNGAVRNYIGYMFGENQLLKGTMNFSSTLLDLNEFMTEEEDDPQAEQEEEESSFGVIKVPKNIDFVLNSEIKTVKIMDMTITGAKGKIIVRDGMVNLSGLEFGLLGGAFQVNGAYDPRDIAKPEYDFDLDIKNLSIQKAFETFTLVQNFAPVAKLVNGNVSTDFKISGLLDQEMMPVLTATSGNGLLKIAQATVEDSKIIDGITKLTKLDDFDQVKLRDVLMKVRIEDGALKVDPFDINLGNFKTTVSGVTGLDGGIAYALEMDLPADKLGSQFSGIVSSYTGGKEGSIPVTIGIGGTYDNPQPTLLLDEQKEQVKQAVTDKAKEEAREKAGNLLDNVKDEKARDVIGNLLGTKKDSTKKDTTNTTDGNLRKKVEEEAKDKIRNLFNRKKDK